MQGKVGKIGLLTVAFLVVGLHVTGQAPGITPLTGSNHLAHLPIKGPFSSPWNKGGGPYKVYISFIAHQLSSLFEQAGYEKHNPLGLAGTVVAPTSAAQLSAIADTTDPRTSAYEVALGNARALKKVGAYDLARIEYDRAMRLNRKNAPEIQKEKEGLLQQENTTGIAIVEEEEVAPLPGSPQWQYDSVVEVATRQFAGRRFDSAIVNYRLAGQILPEQSFPGSQVRAIEWELDQVWKGFVSARVNQLGKEVRAALARKNYTAALPGLYELLHYNPRDVDWVKTQFANVERLLANQGVDTEAMLAKVKLVDVWDVIAQNRPGLPPARPNAMNAQEAANAPSGAGAVPRTRPVAASSLQTEAIPYPAAQLAKLYPEIDFSQMPPQQAFNMIDDQGEHDSAIKKVEAKKATLQLSDSSGNIKVSCEGIFFSRLNTYLKIRVTNNSVADFPVGPMLLSWKQRGLRLVDRVPVAISSYPIIQPGKFFFLYYACRNMYLRDNEELYFSLQGRLGFPKYQISIPGKIYNQEKNKRVNYL